MTSIAKANTKYHWLLAIFLIVGFFLSITIVILFHIRGDQLKELSILQSKAQELVDLQQKNSVNVFSNDQLFHPISAIRKNTSRFNLYTSAKELQQLKKSIYQEQEEIDQAITKKHAEEEAQAQLEKQREQAAAANAPHNNPASVSSAQVPILIYHKPPADFDAQMAALKNKGYTTVSMGEVANYFAGRSKLPSKPVVVTFDDGFYAQYDAIPVLQKYNMKATFYLIVGGQLSNYCIGLLRNNFSCGDAYFNIANIRNILPSGIIEIGSHTIDHPNLASMSEAEQWFQISTSKTFLENTFGKPVTTFAYPYGAYNGTTLTLISRAGYKTAVTTNPGIIQHPSQPYLLNRVRDTYSLP